MHISETYGSHAFMKRMIAYDCHTCKMYCERIVFMRLVKACFTPGVHSACKHALLLLHIWQCTIKIMELSNWVLHIWYFKINLQNWPVFSVAGPCFSFLH